MKKQKRIVIKRKVACKSGMTGWQDRLQNVYAGFEEFCSYGGTFNLYERLGFKTPEACWAANPIVRGSTDPNDYEKVSPKNYNKPSKRGG